MWMCGCGWWVWRVWSSVVGSMGVVDVGGGCGDGWFGGAGGCAWVKVDLDVGSGVGRVWLGGSG